MENCIGCDLISGAIELPGGRIYATNHWVVEHCIGPYGIGSLIVKPIRHCVHFADLFEEEVVEVGPLLKLVSAAITSVLKADQVYICLWSHMNWKPVHIHFLLQPMWNEMKNEYANSGAYIQTAMAEKQVFPEKEKIEEFVCKVKQAIAKIQDGKADVL